MMFFFAASIINNSHPVIVEAIIRLGASLDAVDAEGRSVFRWAAEAGRREVMEMLVDFGCPVWKEAWILNEEGDEFWSNVIGGMHGWFLN